MGHWNDVLKSCVEISKDKTKEVADLAVSASVGLGKWDEAKRWLKDVDSSNENKTFWLALINFKDKKYD